MERFDFGAESGDQICDGGGAFICAIRDAEAPAEIEMADGNAARAQAGNESENFISGFEQRADVEQLGTDVAADSVGPDAGKFGGMDVEFFGGVDIDAELVLAETGGDVGMGNSVDIGIDAQGDGCRLALRRSQAGDGFEFGFGFAVEAVDAFVESVLDFGFGLVHVPRQCRNLRARRREWQGRRDSNWL